MELKGSMIYGNTSGLDEKDLSKVKNDEFSLQGPVLPETKIENEVNWMELPVHLTYLIADKCSYIADLIRFGAVCVCWQSVYTEIRKSRREKSYRQPPLLMLTTEVNSDGQTRSFYSISENKVSKFQAQVPHNTFCQGSSYGWLVILREDKGIYLLNPFLSHNNEIQLRPLTAFEVMRTTGEVIDIDYIIKAVLSSNPLTTPDFVVMAIQGAAKSLAFCRPGDKVWTNLDSKYGMICDIVYHRDKFYAVDAYGRIFTFDFHHSHPIASVFSPAPYFELVGDGKSIVESSGELLQITRNLFDDWYLREGYITMSFDVYKLDIALNEWVRVKSLGNNVLFLGDNSSISLSTLDFPEYKPNCIYFTDEFNEGYFDRVYMGESAGEGPHAMGIFNLEDGKKEPYYKIKSDMIVPPPIWIEPMLW